MALSGGFLSLGLPPQLALAIAELDPGFTTVSPVDLDLPFLLMCFLFSFLSCFLSLML